MSIVITLTPEEAHNTVVLLDLALKHPDGGIKVMNAVVPIVDKINQATIESQRLKPVSEDEAHP